MAATRPLSSDSYTTESGILQFPNEYQAYAKLFDLTADSAVVTVEDGRSIIKAGTIYPANDATARGVVFKDVDVTDGSGAGALIFEAAINENRVPEKPTDAARAALPRITWFPTVTIHSPTDATTAKAGLVKQSTAVADAVDAPTKDEFNALLAALRAAGIVAPNA